MKNSKKGYIVSSIVALVPMIFSVAVYNRLPAQLPMHYNVKGEIDNYADKWVLLFGIPVLMCVLNIIIRFCMAHQKKKLSDASAVIAGWIFPVISIVMVLSVIVFALK